MPATSAYCIDDTCNFSRSFCGFNSGIVFKNLENDDTYCLRWEFHSHKATAFHWRKFVSAKKPRKHISFRMKTFWHKTFNFLNEIAGPRNVWHVNVHWVDSIDRWRDTCWLHFHRNAKLNSTISSFLVFQLYLISHPAAIIRSISV